MTIDSLARQPFELYDMGNDPDELDNLAEELGLSGSVLGGVLRSTASLNEPQLKVYQDGIIPT